MKKYIYFIIVSFVPVLLHSQINLNSGLSAYYSFNGNANDGSGNGHNGIAYNGAQLTTDRFGNPNSAYYFDGIDDYIEILDNGTLSSPNLTITGFFNTESTETQNLVGKEVFSNAFDADYQVFIDWPSAPGFAFNVVPSTDPCGSVNTTTSTYVNGGNQPLSINVWHCFVASFINGVEKIYVDGVLLNTKTTSFTTMRQCNSPIRFGQWYQGLLPFKGKMDDIRFYNRALTDDEISTLCSIVAPDFTIPAIVCPNTPITITNASTGASTYDWNFCGCESVDIASSSSKDPPIIRYSKAGIYTISLIIDKGLPTQSSISKQITILPSPSADFTFSQSVCNPKSIQFATNNTETLSWNMGDGTLVGNNQTPTELYNDYGTYTVKLKATPLYGCADSALKQIPVKIIIDSVIITRDTSACFRGNFQLQALPALDYCWSPTIGLSDPNIANPVITSTLPVTTYYVNALTTGKNLVVNGDFSAGNTGFTSEYTYSTGHVPAGGYLIDVSPEKGNISFAHCNDHTSGSGNMMAMDGAFIPNVKVWHETITVSPNTNYAFSCWVESIFQDNPAKLQFYINGNLIGNIFDAPPVTCQWKQFYNLWNSGDTTTAELAIVNQNTTGIGNDFALDDISFSELKMVHDSVTIAINPNPKIDFDYTIPSCKTPQLQGIATTEPNPLQHWNWNFGDNNTADAQSISHSYTKGGAYTIKLIASDINGCKDSTTKTIRLDTATAVGTSGNPTCAGKTVDLHGTGGTNYEWTPANYLDNPIAQNPLATITNNTRFHLKVTDALGCQDTTSVIASVIPKPAFPKPADMQTCREYPVVLNANANTSYRYAWSPADYLSNPNAASPIAIPITSMQYTLQITEPLCDYDTSFDVKVTVSASANVFVVPNAFTPNGDGKNDCFGIKNWQSTTVKEFSIYNRWGQKVFETKDPSLCWDGNYKGQPQSVGAYVYIIKAVTPCGDVERKGTVMLIR